MFEIAIDGPRHVRVRLGRLHFRTWRSPVMLLPKGYRAPEMVFAVEEHDGTGESHGQMGAFFAESEALKCIAHLESAGYTGLVINVIPVHMRAQDWDFDR